MKFDLWGISTSFIISNFKKRDSRVFGKFHIAIFDPKKDRRGSPCYNKGKCVRKNAAPYFSCECAENYTGLYCELFREKRLEFVPNDEAALQDERCHNGASFDKKTQSCKCLPGFNGDACEKVFILTRTLGVGRLGARFHFSYLELF